MTAELSPTKIEERAQTDTRERERERERKAFEKH